MSQDVANEDKRLDDTESIAWRLAGTASGFLADAYDLFAIDLVVLILGFIYGESVIGTEQRSMIVGSMIAGVIIGQLTFGFLADQFGRKWTFVLTAALTVCSALTSSCCVHRPTSIFSLPLQLTVCRFCLGLGVGGEYPLVAAVTSETAQSVSDRGWYMVLVLSMQGFGMLLSAVIAIVALNAEVQLEVTWRLLLAFGALPSLVAFFLRWHMHESDAYVQDVGRDASVSSATSTIRRFWRPLAGTACCWLLNNFSFYSLSSFKSTILTMLVPPASGTPAREDVLSASWMAALTSGFAIIGWGIGLTIINRVPRFNLQLGGFAAIALLLAAAAALSSTSSTPSWLFILLLGLMYTLQNCGPNLTTFVLPAEIFPTRVRATCHGISAASGKLGAAIGTTGFPQFEASHGLPSVFMACSAASLLGAVVTFGFTPREIQDIKSLEGESAPLADGIKKNAA
mmetsp:Transcript_35481/g.81196  ORF Transcript_35481/g.81196 Transcript_35481/m.81196 type:complete len:456 (-) Transcript_35481:159-1526(-)